MANRDLTKGGCFFFGVRLIYVSTLSVDFTPNKTLF